MRPRALYDGTGGHGTRGLIRKTTSQEPDQYADWSGSCCCGLEVELAALGSV